MIKLRDIVKEIKIMRPFPFKTIEDMKTFAKANESIQEAIEDYYEIEEVINNYAEIDEAGYLNAINTLLKEYKEDIPNSQFYNLIMLPYLGQEEDENGHELPISSSQELGPKSTEIWKRFIKLMYNEDTE